MAKQFFLDDGRILDVYHVDVGQWDVYRDRIPFGKVRRDKSGAYMPNTADNRAIRTKDAAIRHLAKEGVEVVW